MAEEVKDLDFTADLDAIELDAIDDSLDEMDLSTFGEVNETIDKPHIKMSSKELKDFLVVAKQVSVSSGKDFVSKSVAFQVVGDKIYARATDIDVYIEKTFELLNENDILPEPLVIPVDVLVKLAKAVPANTILFKDEEGYKIRLVGGDMPLETYNVDVSKFIFSDSVHRVGTIESKDLNIVLRDFGGVMNQAVMAQEKRILCEDNRAYASHMWSAIACDRPFSKMDIKTKDLNILRSLTAQKEEVLEVSDTDESVKVTRKIIAGSGFKYAFLVSDSKVQDATKLMINKVKTEEGVHVDLIQLYKMVQLAAELNYSIGNIGFNYTDDGAIRMAIKTKKGKDSIFTLTGSSVGNVKPLPSEIVVQAKMLRIILRSFSSCPSVKLAVNPEGLGIESDIYAAAVMVNQK